jgi:hypothetical protein
VLSQFGFSASAGYENVCKTCKQLARARGKRCCDNYDHTGRCKKRVIFDMLLSEQME